MAENSSYRLPTGSGDRWTDNYEHGRPAWPPSVLTLASTPSTSTVLELGAGTGKLTRMLVPHFAHVLAIEPQQAMRRWLVALCPGAHVLDGTAEHIPLERTSVDTVFAAEAFHKFDGECSLREIARVLRPQGMLILLWNIPAGPVEPSITAVDRLVTRLLRDLGLDEGKLDHEPSDLNPTRVSSGEWRRPFAKSPFGEIHQAQLGHMQILDRDALVAFFASMGWIADLTDDERMPVLDEIRSLLTATEYRRPWETHAYWTRLSGSSA